MTDTSTMTPLERFNHWFMASDFPGSMIDCAYEAFVLGTYEQQPVDNISDTDYCRNGVCDRRKEQRDA